MQLIQKSTRMQGNILDLLSNVPCWVTNLTIDTALCYGYSDHFLITASIAQSSAKFCSV